MKKVSFRHDVLPLKDVLYRLALRITQNRADAEDIVQDTLLKVWNRRDTWAQLDSIEAFSLTVCRNLALDKVKRQDRLNASIEETKAEQPDLSSNPYEQTLRRDRLQLVKRLVDGLPEKQRSCMQLRDFEGKPYKEIAEVLGISEEQVKVNIFRARQTIKQRYMKVDNYGL